MLTKHLMKWCLIFFASFMISYETEKLKFIKLLIVFNSFQFIFFIKKFIKIYHFSVEDSLSINWNFYRINGIFIKNLSSHDRFLINSVKKIYGGVRRFFSFGVYLHLQVNFQSKKTREKISKKTANSNANSIKFNGDEIIFREEKKRHIDITKFAACYIALIELRIYN